MFQISNLTSLADIVKDLSLGRKSQYILSPTPTLRDDITKSHMNIS